MKQLLYFIFVSIFLISCIGHKDKIQNTSEAETILKYTDACSQTMTFSTLFNNVEIIPLDTTQNFLLKEIKQMEFTMNLFFVLDGRKQLFVFDRSGKGLAKIDKVGQGAEEYLEIRGFDISLKDSLICMLVYPSKLMYFTFDGKLVNQEKLNFQGYAMDLSHDAIAIFTDNTTLEKKNLLTIKNLLNGEEKEYVAGQRFLAGQLTPGFQQRRYFTTLSDGKTLFFHPLSNLIYSLDNGNVSVKYKLDFGDKNPPVNINQQTTGSGGPFGFIKEHFPVYGFNSCWENDRYFYIQAYIGENLTDLFYDKKTKIYYSGMLLDDMVDCSVKFTEATNQYLAGYVSADDVLGLIDYMKSKNRDLQEKPARKQLFDFAENVGNPAILLYYFKEQ